MKRRKVNWKSQNWDLQNRDIAKLVKRSAARVGQVRKQLGYPDPEHYHQQASTVRMEQLVREHRKDLDGKPLKQIIKFFKRYGIKLSDSSARYSMSRLKVMVGEMVTVRPWGEMNWDLPNTDLTRIWKLTKNAAASRRSLQKRGEAKWSRLGLTPVQLEKLDTNWEYQKALTVEEMEAKRWFRGRKNK